MQKVTVFFMAMVIAAATLAFNWKPKEKVQWLTIEELNVAYAKQPKPVLIDVYTSWCGWCKVMDRETYSKDKVATYLNENYYAVKLDAEARDNFTFNGKQYGYNAAYKSNDLAIYLLAGQMSYPTTVFLPELNAQPAALPGYLKPAELEAPVKYFGTGEYKKKSFQQFNSSFSPSW